MDLFEGDTTDKGTNSTFAFAKKIVDAKGHETERTFDYNAGRIRTQKDPNLQQTSFGYDLLGRLVSVNYPDGGQASYAYIAGTGTIRSSMSRTSSQSVVSERIFDGLGRLCETRVAMPANVIRTVTDYDGGGRPVRTFNPYYVSTEAVRCAAAGGEQDTTLGYDGLDRIKSTTAPDGSTETTDRVANKATITDAAGVKRELVADALDRMAEVKEDPGGLLSYKTYYAYDATDNLTGVCPGAAFDASGNCTAGRKRKFWYDSHRQTRS